MIYGQVIEERKWSVVDALLNFAPSCGRGKSLHLHKTSVHAPVISLGRYPQNIHVYSG